MVLNVAATQVAPDTYQAMPAAVGIDAQIFSELAAAPDGKTDFFIAFWETADLAPAFHMPWSERGQFWENPLTGTIPGPGVEIIDVTFHCTETQDYTGTLRILHDDPCQEAIDIPIVLHCQEEPVEIPDLGDAPTSFNNFGAPMMAYPAVPALLPTVFNPAVAGPFGQGPLHNNLGGTPAWLGPAYTWEYEADIGPD
jgi:hypothetical protein